MMSYLRTLEEIIHFKFLKSPNLFNSDLALKFDVRNSNTNHQALNFMVNPIRILDPSWSFLFPQLLLLFFFKERIK